MSENEYENFTNKELKKLIKRTRATLKEMKAEMMRRKLEDRHAEIDHLEDHIDESERGLANFFAFFKEVMDGKK